MLNISFYAENGSASQSIRVGEEFYQWLAHSDFAQVGHSQLTTICLDGEEIQLPLIPLASTTRSMLIAFFNEMILKETAAMLADLERTISKEILEPRTYRIKKLLELLNCCKNSTFAYLQRE
ncbi:MAG TPA: hypothetical protein DDZ80_01340 [Cyanobacteria bacterium UBA8803]|nr:hypothetical protein [Cyanobacteria bacterium UBA9273]HBL57249.1 hypothetical protein [Cyanobacteria bacterium UBA8803]